MNLAAPFICEFFKDPLGSVLEYADVVIGNETEAETFAKVNSIEGSRADVAKAIAALPYKGNAAKSRTVIITQVRRQLYCQGLFLCTHWCRRIRVFGQFDLSLEKIWNEFRRIRADFPSKLPSILQFSFKILDQVLKLNIFD